MLAGISESFESIIASGEDKSNETCLSSRESLISLGVFRLLLSWWSGNESSEKEMERNGKKLKEER